MLGKRLVVISNRLPIAVITEDGKKVLKPSSGGLVTALSPILDVEGGVWIGWPGTESSEEIQPLINEFNQTNPYKIHPIYLTEEQEEEFYLGFSNQTIWPLFHDLLGLTSFNSQQWETYDEVNRLFAKHVAAQILPDDFVWINDYQLLRVAYHLRDLGVNQPLGFFNHIPFPSPDMFRRLPWAQQIFDGMIHYDSLGFQTIRDRNNFVAISRQHLQGANYIKRRFYTNVEVEGRVVRVGNYPISIDYHEFNRGARQESVQVEMEAIQKAYTAEHLVLGLDRLDHTKGIPERFLAFEHLLEKHPELQGKVSLIQVVVPSRTALKSYADLKQELDSLTGRINSRFGQHGYVPIHFFFKHLNRNELIALYRSCEVALITPLRDGMNLVAKEYAASSIDQRNVLVLSMFTGSADQLGRSALLVNPYDLEGTADALHRAMHMDDSERRKRLRALRAQVKKNDVHRWVKQFVGSLPDAQLKE